MVHVGVTSSSDTKSTVALQLFAIGIGAHMLSKQHETSINTIDTQKQPCAV
jgi:hypothetical protein